MAKVSKVALLPAEVKAWLDKELIQRGFGSYAALEAELGERGHDIGKSSLHRYGQEYSERLEMLKKSVEVSQAITELMGDDQADLANAVSQIALDHCMRLLMKLETDPKEVDFTKLVQAIAALTKSSTTLKQFQQSVRAKAKAVADETGKALKTVAGLSDAAADAIVEKILGIAS